MLRLTSPSLLSSIVGLFVTAVVVACGSDSVNDGDGSGGDGNGDDDGGANADGNDTKGQSIESLFAIPASLDELADKTFYDHPFPSEFRKNGDGTYRFAGFPNPNGTELIPLYVKYMDEVARADGYSPAGGAYLRFTGALEPSSLPKTPVDATKEDSTVVLVDVDAASPERGQRKLVNVSFRAKKGVYVLANTLAVLPSHGFSLRPNTLYAVAVTDGVKSDGGGKVSAPDGLKQVLGLADASTSEAKRAKASFSTAVAELERIGIAKEHLVHLTVYKTTNPTAQLYGVMDAVGGSVAPPTAKDWSAKEQQPAFDAYEGSYGPSPNFQAGKTPYRQPADGGDFAFDANGKPILQNTFDLRFVLAVPKEAQCPMPAAGYPITIYAHGTGGNYRSLLRESGSVGEALASRCIASIGTDQILHGTRPGAPSSESQVELLTYNLLNPAAARTNLRQSAVDVVQEARLFTESKIEVPAGVSRSGSAIKLDGSRLTVFGHSQGSQNGTLFLAGSSAARGGVLSGSGSLLAVALLQKTKPSPSVAALVKVVLGLTTDDEVAELDMFHPVISVAQAVVDVTDSVFYQRALVREPRAGHAPRSIFMTEGIAPDGTGDSYVPPHQIELGAIEAGLPLLAPAVRLFPELAYSGQSAVTIPPGGLKGNLAAGKASGGLSQFVPTGDNDGHFVVFDDAVARAQAADFIKHLAADPIGAVPERN